MTIADYQSLMLPVLEDVAKKGEARVGEVTNDVADRLGLSESERAELLPSGQQTVFYNRIQWAKFYLSKAGLVENTRRGHFKITELGIKLLESKPAVINNELLRQFDAFKAFETSSRTEATAKGEVVIERIESKGTPDEIIRSAYQQIESSLAAELLDRVRSARPEFFERLIVNLLVKMGFGSTVENAARALGRSGDDGVDGVVNQDVLGLEQVYIQAKRYKDGNNVGSSAIRDFLGALDIHKVSKGVFVTTSRFSHNAIETENKSKSKVVLVNGEQLAALMIRYNVGCEIKETLHIRTIDEEFFD